MINSVCTYLYRSAARLPDKTAFSDGEKNISYGELLSAAESGACAISARLGGGRRKPVFVCIERSLESVTAFMAVALSGNFYIPIDPALPDKRLEDIYNATKPELVILTRPGTRELPFGDAETVELSALLEYETDSWLIERLRFSAIDTDPLYCIFTSGSTGVPKGVLVSHRSVIDMAEAFSGVFALDGSEIFGNQAPFDFDVSVKDIFLALRNGGTVHILEKSLFSLPLRLIERMESRGVNTAIWSVSAMKLLSALKTLDHAAPKSLRLMMFSGEVLPCRVLKDWRSHLPDTGFVNLYGPTEITCNCTYYKIQREFKDTDSIPIGRAFPNTGIMLLDGDRLITAPGETGEICVYGSCLALGYYGDEERTAAAFRQNPLNGAWGEKIYRTGDLARYDDEGQLIFLGRADSQVKHMGFRIELGEIETAAGAIEGVSSVCCLYDHQKERLCLFYQGPKQFDRELLKELKKVLPRHMVPGKVYYFERLPENRTGKIDRAALRRDYLE